MSPIKIRVSSNLKADRSNLLANKIVKLLLRLAYNIQNNIQNNSRPKTNYKIVYYSLKHMSLRGIKDHGDTKYQNFENAFEDR